MRFRLLMGIMLGLVCWGQVHAYERDPTEPVSYNESMLMKTALTIELDGIIVGKGRLLAIINGESFGVKQKVGKWTITEISTDKVTLTDADKHLVLELTPTIKQRMS